MGAWFLFKCKGMCLFILIWFNHLIKPFHTHLQTKIPAEVFVHVFSHGLHSEHFISLRILEDVEKVNVDRSGTLEKYGRENG